MSRKKTSPQVQRADAVRQRLDYLYARRAAVIHLIESLEAYYACSSRKATTGFRASLSIPSGLLTRIEA